jgi:biopolymer transport protein ExbD
MDPLRLRALIAPAMASLFLVLSLCAFVVQRPEPVGMHLPLPQMRAVPHKVCDFLSDRSVVVQLHKNGKIWINETQVNYEKLGPILTEIYENRAEKFIYIISDYDVSYSEFANLYSTIVSSTNDLHIVLRTRQFDKEVLQCTQGSDCGLFWPGHGFSGVCLYSLIPPVNVPHHSFQ